MYPTLTIWWRWLEKRSRLIKLGAEISILCMYGDHDGGEHAHDALEHEMQRTLEADGLEILHKLKLYKAIKARSEEVFAR